MANRTDTQNRYLALLNEWQEYCEADMPITIQELIKKYGVSSAFTSFISMKGIFKREGGSKFGRWIATHQGSFTIQEVKSLIVGYRSFREQKKHPVIKDRILGEVPAHNGVKSKLVDVSTQELITELRRRGYTGKITSEINF